jgi:carboxyl-terminal processing protease
MDPRPPAAPKPWPVYLILLLGFMAGGVSERYFRWVPGTSGYQPAGLGHTFDTFWEAWDLVDKFYVDRSAVQPVRMTRGAIAGMLDSLGDARHTTYLTPEAYQQLQSDIKGQYGGIGARMTVRNRQPTVMNTIAGSPAADKLKAGDVFVRVDGKDVSGMDLLKTVELVQGPPGSVVRLRVLRKGKPVDVSIARAKIDLPEVTGRMLPRLRPKDPRIAQVAIAGFGGKADEQLRAVLKDVRRQGARGLVLDLRANPGGLRDQAVAVTSEFLKGGVVFIEKDAQGNEKQVEVIAGGVATDVPLSVLIDEGSASSAEIFAGAIQDHKRGKLVGTRTIGTGTVLGTFELKDHSAILLAVAEWLTPDGRQIWHKGIEPDIQVTLPQGATVLRPESDEHLDAETLAKSTDKQLLKALEVLTKQMGAAAAPAK